MPIDLEPAHTRAMVIARAKRMNGGLPLCEVCGLAPGGQMAHRIPQNKRNLKRYGPRVIHHPLNIKWVCSLRCNSAASINNRPLAIQQLIDEIMEDLQCQLTR